MGLLKQLEGRLSTFEFAQVSQILRTPDGAFVRNEKVFAEEGDWEVIKQRRDPGLERVFTADAAE